MTCLFCRIAGGDADAPRVYETPSVVAFLDANPAVRGHTLVVPRDHDGDVFDDADESAAVFDAVRRVARALETVLDADGVSVFYTTPDLVGDVTHPHVHVLPRDEGDSVHLSLDRGALGDREGERLAARIGDAV